MAKKMEKGEYGYLKHRKLTGTVHFLLLVAAGVLLFFVGLLLNKWDVKNIFTILAILMVLPTARVLVSLIILIPSKQSDKKTKDLIDTYKRDNDVLFYDPVFTSSEHVMHLNALLISGHQVVGFTVSPEKKNKTEEYFKKEFSARNLNMIYFYADSEKEFASRMKKRAEEGTLSEKEAFDMKEVSDMIRTAIV